MDWTISILTLLKAVFTSLSSEPILLLLAVVIVGVGYLLTKAGNAFADIFKSHMESLGKRMEDIAENMEKISSDLKKLSSSFEVHVVKTEFRIDQLEKRIERMEKIHLKEEP